MSVPLSIRSLQQPLSRPFLKGLISAIRRLKSQLITVSFYICPPLLKMVAYIYSKVAGKGVLMDSLWALAPRLVGFSLYRLFGFPKLKPANITVSVTNKCNSRCLTCNIWKFYSERSAQAERELTVKEYEKIFASLGKSPFWVSLSGGEPFLRDDLPAICKEVVEKCCPSIINIPSNGLLRNTIGQKTKEILEIASPASLIINLSMDGLWGRHDRIRGVPGNFDTLLETYRDLTLLKHTYPQLHIGIHSVVSRYSVDDLFEVYEYVKTMKPDSYITEVAEERSELFNIGERITPDPTTYSNLVDELSRRIKEDEKASRKIAEAIKVLRLVYYKIAARVLTEQRQVIPCYAGFVSCQISPFGDVWPCCVLGYSRSMGNLRDVDYDFSSIWFSERADEIRKEIKAGRCACPLANAHYTSMLFDFRTMVKVLQLLLSR